MSLFGILDRLADVPTFDRLVEPARSAVNAILQPQAAKDVLPGSWLGPPLHPVLAMGPVVPRGRARGRVGPWRSAGTLGLPPPTRPAAPALITPGVAASLPTALAGAAD